MTALVATRPERTAREIAADRKEANAFWARMEKYDATSDNPAPRDLRRQLAREAQYSYRLMMAWAEQRGIAQLIDPTPGPQQRVKDPAFRARHFDRFRIDANLREYVDEETRQAMPAPQLHRLDKDDRKKSVLRTAAYWKARRSATPLQIERAERDRAPFEHWLLHPRNYSYGPRRDEATKPVTTPSWARYRKGEVHTVGMTPERALQIALAALPK